VSRDERECTKVKLVILSTKWIWKIKRKRLIAYLGIWEDIVAKKMRHPGSVKRMGLDLAGNRLKLVTSKAILRTVC
jgi:hypothetical protein